MNCENHGNSRSVIQVETTAQEQMLPATGKDVEYPNLDITHVQSCREVVQCITSPFGPLLQLLAETPQV